LRKLKEAILTWRIEQTLTKRRILELYLNAAEWGKDYSESKLLHFIIMANLHQNWVLKMPQRLASVLPNPRKYCPTGTSRYVEKRSKLIYDIMVKRGIVTEEYDL
jgi:monofunctional biosynthetic peptidoglycan transglycosylase